MMWLLFEFYLSTDIDNIRHSPQPRQPAGGDGISPLLIAERLGHEKVQTTMDTYSHLYPNKQVEVARQLDGIMP